MTTHVGKSGASSDSRPSPQARVRAHALSAHPSRCTMSTPSHRNRNSNRTCEAGFSSANPGESQIGELVALADTTQYGTRCHWVQVSPAAQRRQAPCALLSRGRLWRLLSSKTLVTSFRRPCCCRLQMLLRVRAVEVVGNSAAAARPKATAEWVRRAASAVFGRLCWPP